MTLAWPSPANAFMEEKQQTTAEFIEAAIRRERSRLFQLAKRRLGSIEEADDAVQEACIRILRHGHRFDRSRPFFPWAARILENICFDMLRQRRHSPPPLSIHTGLIDDLTLDVPDHAPGPLDTLLLGELSEPVQNALLALPDKYREAVILCDIAECSYEEIAEAVRIPLGTVRSRISRGHLLLRLALSDRKDHR